MLCSIDRQLVTDDSGQPIGPIFKGQAVKGDGTDKLSWNVGNWLPIYDA
jgi:hypothetical protein